MPAPTGRWGQGPAAIVGGDGSPSNPAVPTIIKGTPLMVNGVLYVTSPDNGWALDARDGREMWHYFWRTRGGTPIGNRGFGLWNNALFMVTPDDFIVSLDAKTGKERWNKEFAPFTQQYFSTIAPMVIGNTVIVGTGNDLDSPGYLQAYDADTGKELWRFYTVPQNAGDPGVDTWPSLQAARYGGGHPWLPGVYDPETNLYIFGTGNPIPAYTLGRGEGDNLFTCALIAVDVATGKMKWYFQTSPHDMHDWDSAQTPVLFEGTVGGKKRKLVATAARNGYFFTLDRTTGEKVVVTKYGSATNWAKPHRPEGLGPARADQGSDRRRRPDLADVRRHDQLGAAGLLAGHRPVLRLGAQRPLDLLPDRSRIRAARWAWPARRKCSSATPATSSPRSIR